MSKAMSSCCHQIVTYLITSEVNEDNELLRKLIAYLIEITFILY